MGLSRMHNHHGSEPMCFECGYNLSGHTCLQKCSECGRPAILSWTGMQPAFMINCSEIPEYIRKLSAIGRVIRISTIVMTGLIATPFVALYVTISPVMFFINTWLLVTISPCVITYSSISLWKCTSAFTRRSTQSPAYVYAVYAFMSVASLLLPSSLAFVLYTRHIRVGDFLAIVSAAFYALVLHVTAILLYNIQKSCHCVNIVNSYGNQAMPPRFDDVVVKVNAIKDKRTSIWATYSIAYLFIAYMGYYLWNEPDGSGSIVAAYLLTMLLYVTRREISSSCVRLRDILVTHRTI